MDKRTHYIATTIFLVCLCAPLAGCESESGRERGRQAQSKPVVAPDGSIRLTPEQAQADGIQTAEAAEREIAPTITAVGRVAPRAGAESQVFSSFAGSLIADPSRLPRAGSFVKKGQVIAEVEQFVTAAEQAQFKAQSAQLQSTIDQARQEVSLRQIELDRARRLYNGGAVPLKQAQTAEFNLKQAQEKLEGARLQKAQYDAITSQRNNASRRAPIVAPISGVVTAAGVVAGQMTNPATSLLTIVDLSSVWVEAPVHESNLAAARGAKSVEITTPAAPGRTYTGTLVTIGAVVDPTNRTVPVTFAALNHDGSLKIGMTAEARIPTGPVAKALVIPFSAALYEEAQAIVYVESEPGVFRRRTITVGKKQDDTVVVTSGLRVGEKVVSVGAATLRSETYKGQIPAEEEGERR